MLKIVNELQSILYLIQKEGDMALVVSDPTVILWHDLIKFGQSRCAVNLKEEQEKYLISLLMRYLDKPDVVKKVFALAFLGSFKLAERQREVGLKQVGDECLLFAGLFPRSTERKQIKVVYYVDLGRTAYAAVSKTNNDIFSSLSSDFVTLMDVLQAVALRPDLMPLEAYEQWNELGSKRSLQILREYTSGTLFKDYK